MQFVMKALGRGLSAAALALALPAGGTAFAQPARPTLVVAISVDQFSANLFEAWRDRFTGGMARLAGGVAYPSGYHSHGGTETCPGHSTLLTGKHPSKTGIVGNQVRDPRTGEQVYCLFDPGVTLAHDPKANPVSPAPMMATTLGDWLKAASPQSRVVAVAGKDRAAITMAGQNPDAVFWLPELGAGFTTYVRPGQDAAARLAPVAAVNARIAAMMTTQPNWAYAHPDCRAATDTLTVNGAAYHAQLPPEAWTPTQDPAEIRRRVRASSTYDNATFEAARAMIAGFNLGRGPQTDLLAVGFSSGDMVGHRYGTRGPEMCEQLHNLDRLVGQLLGELDGLKVPYLVVLTADHGGSDAVERLAAAGYPARRVPAAPIFERINKAVTEELGLSAPALAGPLDDLMVAPGLEAWRKPTVIATAIRVLEAQPEIAGAFSQAELLATFVPPGKAVDELTLRERYALSTYPGRSPDIMVAMQPFTTPYPGRPGGDLAGHGSPWNYDRRVPILFWWSGAPSQTRFLPVATVDIAPTLANILGLTPPADIDGRCLPVAIPCPAPR